MARVAARAMGALVGSLLELKLKVTSKSAFHTNSEVIAHVVTCAMLARG